MSECQNFNCGKVGIHKCAKCGAAFYCSKKCQVSNWKLHRKMCGKGICVEDLLKMVKSLDNDIDRITSIRCLTIISYGLNRCHVDESPKKGVFATQKIAKGEIVTLYPAHLIIRWSLEEKHDLYGHKERCDMYISN